MQATGQGAGCDGGHTLIWLGAVATKPQKC